MNQGNRLVGRHYRPGVHLVVAGAVLAVLVGANLLNNVVAPAAYVLTSVAAAAVLVLLARVVGLTWADLGLARAHAGRGMVWAAALVCGVVGVYLAAAALPATRGLFHDQRIIGADLGDVLYMALVRIPLGTVLLEEVAFRGVVYGWAARRWSPVRGVLLSSTLFGLWHVLPAHGIENLNSTLREQTAEWAVSADTLRTMAVVAGVVAAAAAGAFLCELRRRSRSLLAPAGLHLATNAAGVLVAATVIGIL